MSPMFSTASIDRNKGCAAAIALVVLIASAGFCLNSEWVKDTFSDDETAETNQQHAPSEIVESTQWSVWNTGIEAQLFDVYSPGEGEAWACGTDGTIVHTSDGGETWEARPSGTGEDLDSIFFTDSETGFAAGSNGAFVRTNDAGKTWLPVDLPVPCMRCIHFWDSEVGYAVGNFGTLYRTVDGGDNWTQQDSGVDDEIATVFVADETAAYFTTDAALYGTSDGGHTWGMVDYGGATPNDIAVDHQGRIWIVGDDGIWTSENGTDFVQVPTDAAPGPYGSLAVNSAANVGAGNGFVLTSVDDTPTWDAQDTGLGAQVDGLFRNIDGELWATSSQADSVTARVGVKLSF